MIRPVLIIAFLVINCSVSIAQLHSRTITGQVTSFEESAPLEGVTVQIKGSNKVSGSQADGVYYINVTPDDSILVFSYHDFATVEIRVSDYNEQNVVLKKATVPYNNRAQDFLTGKIWRGYFTIAGDEVPFNFEFVPAGTDKYSVFFLNGDERFDGGLASFTGDSLVVLLNQFENEIVFSVEQDALTGVLRKQDKTGTPVLVTANKLGRYRFHQNGLPPYQDISGTYDIVLNDNNGKPEKAVGIFKQTENKLTATFLRITGDSRFLEGVIEGNQFYLSSFIGSQPVYYKGTLDGKEKLSGDILSVNRKQHFTGIKDATAALPDAGTLTGLKPGYETIDFSFPDVNGRPVSLRDEKYTNKVVILTITGSWCPNCIDETSFLAPWYAANKNRGVEIIAIHYERKLDTAYTRKALTRWKDKFGVQYDQVIGGIADKKFVASSLPALNNFLSFPTTIFIDKKGKVASIHTGFSGPATGRYYDTFIQQFNSEVDRLLK